MLRDRHVHATIPAADMDRARSFYEEKLGLTAEDAPGGMVFRQGGTSWFLVYPSRGAGTAQHTVLGFETDDIDAEVRVLKERGVEFEEYDFPGLTTVDSIATTGPVRAAWFRDSEGNILGLVQLPRDPA